MFASARLRAWAERLEELGRVEESRRVLQEALDRSTNPVPAALMLAQLDARTGAAAQAAELLRKVLGDNPGNLRAAQMLARILLDAGKVEEAARVVADVSSTARESAELAELAGEILMAQGKHAQAVEAFGPRASLSPRGRRLRRRSWWRSGGPLRQRSGRETVHTGTTQAGTSTRPADPPDTTLEAITWARWLSGQDRRDDARQVISEVLAAYGRHPALLACAAGIEAAADAQHTALYLWREAHQQAPHDVDVICGLALCLADTLVKPSNTWRVSDALQVLDCFPDQNHPQIRSARADVLRSNNASAVRLVAAYGPVDGLSMADARTRRRLWWRSAGPLGQLCVRVTDRIRGERRTRPVSDQVPRTEAESEAVARVLDSLDKLTPPEARKRIAEAWEQHGRQPSLLLAYAAIDESNDVYWHCLALAAEAARTSANSLDTVCALASALDMTYGYGAALQVLESLPAAGRHTVEARVIAGGLHRYEKNFALAATAYGDPRDLDRFDRKSRRHCARRALLQRLRSVGGGDVDVIDPASFDPVSPAIARVLDQLESLINEPARLRELACRAFEEHGRHPMLLLMLAYAERTYGDRHLCAALAAEAMRSAPEDPLVVAGSIRELWFADYDAEALRAIAEVSEQLTTSPAVRGTSGDVYRYWRLRAHAMTAYGRSGLEAWRWRNRRVCWWWSGGPVRRIRSSILTRENSLLSDLPLPAQQTAALSALELPPQVKDAVRSDLATYHMSRTNLTVFRPGVFDDWVDRMFVPTAAIIVFATLAVAERLRWPSAGMVYCLTVAALDTAVVSAALWITGKITSRWATRICVAVASGIGAAFLLRSPGQLAFSAGLALGAFAFGIVAGFMVLQTVRFVRRLRTVRWQRRQAETAVLSALLDLLGQLLMPQQRRDANVRRVWMADLERAAITIDRDLPHALQTGDPASQSEITARARSAATTLRDIKQAIALPNEASSQALIKQLTGLAAALARHDFGNWPPPPQREETASRPPRPLWRQAVDTGRTVLVIFMPALVAYLLPLWVPLSGPGLSWLRFAAIVWALLGILVALDPVWTDRVTKMRQGLDVLRNAAPPKGGNESAAPYGPADTAPRTPDVQRQAPARRTRTRSRR
jgi:tetratricopeptide (TPR) repeat protein